MTNCSPPALSPCGPPNLAELYSEERRLALEELLAGGPDAFRVPATRTPRPLLELRRGARHFARAESGRARRALRRRPRTPSARRTTARPAPTFPSSRFWSRRCWSSAGPPSIRAPTAGPRVEAHFQPAARALAASMAASGRAAPAAPLGEVSGAARPLGSLRFPVARDTVFSKNGTEVC